MAEILFLSLMLNLAITKVQFISFSMALLAFSVTSEIHHSSIKSHTFVAEDIASHSFSNVLSTLTNKDRNITVTGCAVECLMKGVCHGFYYNKTNNECRLMGGTFSNSTDPQFNKPLIMMFRYTDTTDTSPDSSTAVTTNTAAVTTTMETTTTTEVEDTTEAPFHCSPEGGFEIATMNGKKYCFLLVEDEVTFTQARKKCNEKGAILYHFEGDMDKLTGLKNAIKPFNPEDITQVWVGMHTLYGFSQWTWDHNNRTLTIAEVAALPWEEGYKVEANECLQTEMETGTTKVDDKGCTKENSYLCERV